MKDARYDSIQGVLLTAFALVTDYFIVENQLGKPPSLWIFLVLFAIIGPLIGSFFQRRRAKAKAELDYLVNLRRHLEQNTQ